MVNISSSYVAVEPRKNCKIYNVLTKKPVKAGKLGAQSYTLPDAVHKAGIMNLFIGSKLFVVRSDYKTGKETK